MLIEEQANQKACPSSHKVKASQYFVVLQTFFRPVAFDMRVSYLLLLFLVIYINCKAQKNYIENSKELNGKAANGKEVNISNEKKRESKNPSKLRRFKNKNDVEKMKKRKGERGGATKIEKKRNRKQKKNKIQKTKKRNKKEKKSKRVKKLNKKEKKRKSVKKDGKKEKKKRRKNKSKGKNKGKMSINKKKNKALNKITNNKRMNKKDARNKRKKQKKTKESKKRMNKESKKKKNTKKNGNKKKKGKASKKRRKGQRKVLMTRKENSCQNVTCLNTMVQVMKIKKDQVKNFLKQNIRITKKLALAGNKGSKSSNVNSSLSSLGSSLGGESALSNKRAVCHGKYNITEANEGSKLYENMAKCDSGIKNACKVSLEADVVSELSSCENLMMSFK